MGFLENAGGQNSVEERIFFGFFCSRDDFSNFTIFIVIVIER